MTLSPLISKVVTDIVIDASEKSVRNIAAPNVTGIGYTGQTLTSTNGVWVSPSTPSYTYQWFSDDAEISGETSSTYTVTTSEEGKAIYCEVTATQGGVSASERSNEIHQWVPTDNSLLISWHDSSDASTITESSGAVSQLDDKSGNGYHLSQGVGANQPTTGVATINSLNAINYTNDHLENTSYDLPLSGDVCFFSLLNLIGGIGNANDSVVSCDNAAGRDFQFNSNSATQFDGALSSSSLGDGTKPLLNPPYSGLFQYSVVFDFTGESVFFVTVDGVKETADGNYINTLREDMSLNLMANRAGTNRVDGDVAELVVIEGADLAERNKIEGYLAHKWGQAASLPSSHPYKGSPPAV